MTVRADPGPVATARSGDRQQSRTRPWRSASPRPTSARPVSTGSGAPAGRAPVRDRAATAPPARPPGDRSVAGRTCRQGDRVESTDRGATADVAADLGAVQIGIVQLDFDGSEALLADQHLAHEVGLTVVLQ